MISQKFIHFAILVRVFCFKGLRGVLPVVRLAWPRQPSLVFSNSYHSEGATHLLRFCYRFLLFSESVVVRDAAVFDRSREIAHEQE